MKCRRSRSFGHSGRAQGFDARIFTTYDTNVCIVIIFISICLIALSNLYNLALYASHSVY